jgi:hypothetical protein
MILEIIGWIVLILLIPTFIYLLKKSKNKDTYQNETFAICAVFTVVIFIILLVSALAGSFIDDTYKSQFSIVSMSRQNEISGSFFLGTGTIEEVTYYYTYRQEMRGLTLEKIPTIEVGEKVYIVETNEISPRYVDERICEEKPSALNWIQGCERTRKLIVPRGTIVREFRA